MRQDLKKIHTKLTYFQEKEAEGGGAIYFYLTVA